MKTIAVGEWVICDIASSPTVGKVVYADADILVLKTPGGGSWMTGVRDLVGFVGTREKVLALAARIEAMSKRTSKATLVLQQRIKKREADHERAVRKLLGKQLANRNMRQASTKAANKR